MRCEFAVRVTPRSSQNRMDSSADPIKVWVSASPTDGQANEAVCRLIAKELGVPPSSVRVLRGHSARDKVLSIEGLDADSLRERLGRLDV